MPHAIRKGTFLPPGASSSFRPRIPWCSAVVAGVLLLIATYGESNDLTGINPGGCAITPSGILSFYTAEGHATDVAGVFAGILTGNTTYDTGKVGLAHSFDGAGDYVQLDSAPSATSFTVEGWVYLQGDNPGYRTIYGGTFGTRGFFLLNRRLNWWHGVDVFTGDTQIPPDQWHHIAITYAGDTGSFTGYVDGIGVGDSFSPGTSLPTPAFIGGDDVGEDLVGLVDELSVYDRALSQNDIQRVFLADSLGKCLVFNGHFETGELSRWSSYVP